MHIGSKNIYETRGTFDANNLIEHYSQLSHERDILQPEDVCWFKLMKNKYKIFWNDWFLNDEKILTKHGNISEP
ncbi:hypothetical protein BpHYR1_047088, partial [Brachionus plicatilis]